VFRQLALVNRFDDLVEDPDRLDHPASPVPAARRGSRPARRDAADPYATCQPAAPMMASDPRVERPTGAQEEAAMHRIATRASTGLWIDSAAGHLICCNADPQATRTMGRAIHEFLDELTAHAQARR
jgi:hypothetical protein